MPKLRPELRHPMTLRITAEQDAAIHELSARDGISRSDAHRLLLDRGITAEAELEHGVWVSPAAAALLADGRGAHTARLRLAGVDADAELRVRLGQVLDVEAAGVDAILSGVVAWVTAEQAAEVTELLPTTYESSR